MTGPCNRLYKFQIVSPALLNIAMKSLSEGSSFVFIVMADKLAYHLFRNVTANIFIVIASALYSRLFYLFEHVQASSLIILGGGDDDVAGDLRVRRLKYKRTIADISRMW